MTFTPLEIPGTWLIEPVRHGDSRGYFCETFREGDFREHVGKVDFVQDNESLSTRGVLRGLHLQLGEAAQAKLVRVSRGRIVDVAVDMRKGSPTFCKHIMVELSQDNGRQLFLPRGMAHGFVVLSDEAQFQYKVDNYYCPGSEATLLWNDPALGIDWPIGGLDLNLSEKDQKGLPLAQFLGPQTPVKYTHNPAHEPRRDDE